MPIQIVCSPLLDSRSSAFIAVLLFRVFRVFRGQLNSLVPAAGRAGYFVCFVVIQSAHGRFRITTKYTKRFSVHSALSSSNQRPGLADAPRTLAHSNPNSEIANPKFRHSPSHLSVLYSPFSHRPTSLVYSPDRIRPDGPPARA